VPLLLLAAAGCSEEERVNVGEELSDVLLYLVRLADICDVDLGAAVMAKMAKNALK
jgi:dCTP diphosphatase